MSAQEIIELAMTLKATERFAIVDKLIESLDHPDPAIDALWADEAECRLKAFDQGQLSAISISEALDHLE